MNKLDVLYHNLTGENVTCYLITGIEGGEGMWVWAGAKVELSFDCDEENKRSLMVHAGDVYGPIRAHLNDRADIELMSSWELPAWVYDEIKNTPGTTQAVYKVEGERGQLLCYLYAKKSVA